MFKPKSDVNIFDVTDNVPIIRDVYGKSWVLVTHFINAIKEYTYELKDSDSTDLIKSVSVAKTHGELRDFLLNENDKKYRNDAVMVLEYEAVSWFLNLNFATTKTIAHTLNISIETAKKLLLRIEKYNHNNYYEYGYLLGSDDRNMLRITPKFIRFMINYFKDIHDNENYKLLENFYKKCDYTDVK